MHLGRPSTSVHFFPQKLFEDFRTRPPTCHHFPFEERQYKVLSMPLPHLLSTPPFPCAVSPSYDGEILFWHSSHRSLSSRDLRSWSLLPKQRLLFLRALTGNFWYFPGFQAHPSQLEMWGWQSRILVLVPPMPQLNLKPLIHQLLPWNFSFSWTPYFFC